MENKKNDTKRKEITSPSFFIGKLREGLISFGSGQPDLPPPNICFDFLKDYKEFKYGEVQGNPKLREVIAKDFPNATKDNIVITNGASEAIDIALRALYVEKGKVLVPRPYYYSYPFNVELAHMIPVFYDLDNGKINIDTFKELAKDARAVLINSPSNPTGTIQEITVLKEIEKLSEKYGFYIISDEVYKDMIYERENYLIKGENVLTVNSFSKTYSLCGARIGYVYARNKEWIEKMVEIKTHTSMNTSIIGQEMALMATTAPRKYIDDNVKIWKKRRDLIYKGLKDLGLEVSNPEGAFYILVSVNNPSRVVNDLYYDYDIVTYNGEWFGKKNSIRLSYALHEEKILEGLKRIKKYLETDYEK